MKTLKRIYSSKITFVCKRYINYKDGLIRTRYAEIDKQDFPGKKWKDLEVILESAITDAFRVNILVETRTKKFGKLDKPKDYLLKVEFS